MRSIESGARLVAHARETISEVVTRVQQVSSLIAEINAASKEQYEGIFQVGEAVGSIERMTQQNVAMVAQCRAVARGSS